MQLDQLKHIGAQLKRPECVLAHQSGLLFVADWTENGGVSVISRAGVSHKILANAGYSPIRPNGIALEPNGTFLLAHLGNSDGGVYRLYPNGELEAVVTHANGEPLPPCNFIALDSQERLWLTISTRVMPRGDDYRPSANSGFIAVAEKNQKNAKIVADQLAYTNELVIDSSRNRVVVNETFGRRLSEFTLTPNGLLTNKKTLAKFEAGTYPDGVAMDENGDFWISSIISNRIIKVTEKGEQQLILEDSIESHLAQCENAFINNSLGREHLDKAHSQVLQNASSLAFGGHDRKQVYIGNLLGDCLHYFEADVAGAVLPHWNVPLGALEQYID